MTFTTHIIARDKWARFMTIMTALFLSVILYSCSNDLSEENIPDVEQQSRAEITFNILTNTTPTTRADSHTEKKDGTDKEKAINSLQVLLYNQSNQFIGKFETTYFANSSYKGSIDYEKMSSSLDENQTFKGKIMILANCPQFDGTGDLASHTFDFSQTAFNPNNEDGYIPMWGVINSELKIVKGGTVDFGTVDLLRALAKIELIPQNGFGEDGYKIVSATLSHYSTSGACAPANCMTKTPTADAEEDICNIPNGVRTKDNLTFKDNVLYLPEMKGNADNVVNLTLQKGDEKKNVSFRLGNYSNGDFVDNTDNNIVRNHIYRYYLNCDSEDNIVYTISIRNWKTGKYAILTPED